MAKQIDVALGVLGVETTFAALANSNDPAEQLVAASQIAAAMSSLLNSTALGNL